MKIIGIDLSLNSTGIADGDDPRIIVPPKPARNPRGFGDDMERLSWIRKTIEAEIKYADVVVLEGYSYDSGNRAHQVGELGGQIRLLLWSTFRSYAIVAPSAVKKYATGKGNAAKEVVVSSVSARSGLIFEGAGATDRADAWTLRQMAIAHYLDVGAIKSAPGDYVGMPKLHAQALDKVEWPSLGYPHTVPDGPRPG